ncbi:flavin reductase family protein [Rhizobium sp. R693]|uniref:flavin reductase family protein n=1 Tax=Rhizobium sp. R693 TaxID=1764276 RepID=UPI000B52DB26|nr:flavin reductase family protein [Rhizobium sp. R693]OWV98750.1 hypothetical protein ATY79_18985 [Rhizobium sp. R693]
MSEASTSFNFEAMSSRDRYKILTGTIVPRPIALVSTVDLNGVVNAAPISFFNCLSSDPAMLVLGIAHRDDGTRSDTAKNIGDTGVFVVNVVSRAMLQAMNVCGIPFPAGVSELTAAELHAVASDRVIAPRIVEAPAAFECRRTVTLSVDPTREIILGEVVTAHVKSHLINERLHTDQRALDAVGRMGGATYAFSTNLFDLETPSLAAWEASRVQPKSTVHE